jgi:thiamine kinase-like enzyme
MQESEFRQIINSISDELWQEHLSIGNVRDVRVERIIGSKYSHIAKCALKGSSGCSNVYVKLYRNDRNLPPEEIARRIQTDYQTLCHYYDRFNESDQFGVVKPIFFLQDYNILVTEEAVGKTLYDVISESCRYIVSKKKLERVSGFLNQVGAWLRYFQSLDDSQSEQYSIEKLIEYMVVRLKILTENSLLPSASLYSKRIMEYVERNEERCSPQELFVKPSHNDFNLGNIIIQSDRVTVLDFSKIKKDSFLVDVSRVYHQLFLMTFKYQYRMVTIRKLQNALLEGFGMSNAYKLMLFRFLLIRHTLTHLLGITRSSEKSFAARIYNRWVINRELRYLDSILSGAEI